MRSLTFFVVVPLCLVLGCGDKQGGRLAVSGKVTLNNAPLNDGIIAFEPLDGQDTRGGGMIAGGAYKVPRESGLKPGKYLVRISAGDGSTPHVAEEGAAPGPTPVAKGRANVVSKDLVPKEWNTNSRQQVTVTTEGPNTFDFDIK